MSLLETINSDIKQAMLAKKKDELPALRAVKSELLLLETAGGNKKVDENDEIKLLQKLIKQRKESAAVYEEQNREDLAADEKVQAEIIARYLPAQMSEEEVTAVIKEVISQTGAAGPQDMGKVMGMANQKLAGKAEGKLIAGIAKSLLAG